MNPGAEGFAGTFAPASPQVRTRSRVPLVIALVVAVLALFGGVGGFAAYRVLSGGGTQPEDVLPADTFAFADVDLDPSAAQKLGAYEFMRKMPKVGSAFDQRNDLKKSVWDAVASLGGIDKNVSYETDIKPWLGDRLAIGARPAAIHSDSPDVLVAIQSKDDSKARAALTKLTHGGGTEFAFRKGYVLLSDSRAIVDRAITDAARGSLRSSAHFAADMKLIGDAGFSSGWLDVPAMVKALPPAALGGLNLAGSGGGLLGGSDLDSVRMAYVLRFMDGGAELVFKAIGAKPAAAATGPASGFPTIADLPSDTAAALHVYGLGAQIDQFWAGLEKGFAASGVGGQDPIAQFEHEFGVTLPEDLKTLLGSDLIAALSAAGLADHPSFGVRTHTDGAAADKVLKKLTDGGLQVPGWKTLPDGIVVASSEAYANVLAEPKAPRLGDQASFRKALPDAGTGQLELFVNVAAIADELQGRVTDPDALKALKAFSGVGVSVKAQGTTATGVFRVVLR